MSVEAGPQFFIQKGPPWGTRERGRLGSVFEAPAFVAGLDDIAVVGEPVEQGRGHFGVAKDIRPFAEGEIGGDDDRSALIEATDQVEQQLAAGLANGR